MMPYLNQAQNGWVRNEMQLKGSRRTKKEFQPQRNSWASNHTNHLSGTTGQILPEPCQKGQGSLTESPMTFTPFLETKEGISSPEYEPVI